MYKKIFSAFVITCAFIISSVPLHAVEGTGTDSGDKEKLQSANDEIIITGKRYESSVLKEGKAVTVITEEEIKDSGKSDLSQVLDTVPGITVTRQGTESGNVNIYIRGSKSGNVLVLIDGVKINDPSDINNTVDLSLIKTCNIERIEIVEGSMSSLYGAEASGGVINIITKKGKGNSVSVKFEGGAYDSYSQSVSVNETGEKGSFFFSGSHYTSGGISAAKDMTGSGDFDDDGTDYYNASCKMTGELWDKTSMVFTMNYADKEMDIDYDSGIDDPNYTASSRLFTATAEFRHSPLTWFNYRAGGSFMSMNRTYDNKEETSGTGPNAGENISSVYSSHGLKGQLLGNLIIPVTGILSFGGEVLEEKTDVSMFSYYPAYSSTSFNLIDDKSVTTLSAFIHDAFSLKEMLFLNAGGRIDNHSEFGNHYTWDTSGAFIIPVIKTKIRGSVGSGFKAPSLYQLYENGYGMGNPDLKPEKSFVYDAGIYQEIPFSENKVSLEGTYFYQRYRDMITTVSNKYTNIDGEMSDRGVELAVSIKLRELLTLRYAYTYLDFLKNNSTQPFLRRPEHKHAVELTVKPLTGLSINASYLYVGSRYDYYYDYGTYTSSIVDLDAYHKVDANIRYEFSENIAVNVRGENLTNEDYMDTYGYNTYDRSFFGGVELTF